jgi:hypothetical protein
MDILGREPKDQARPWTDCSWRRGVACDYETEGIRRPKLSCPPKRGLNVGRAMSKEGLSVAVERGCGGTSLAVDWSLAHVVGEGFV